MNVGSVNVTVEDSLHVNGSVQNVGSGWLRSVIPLRYISRLNRGDKCKRRSVSRRERKPKYAYTTTPLQRHPSTPPERAMTRNRCIPARSQDRCPGRNRRTDSACMVLGPGRERRAPRGRHDIQPPPAQATPPNFVEWVERITVPSLRSSGPRSWVASQRRAAPDRLRPTLRITRRMALVAFARLDEGTRPAHVHAMSAALRLAGVVAASLSRRLFAFRIVFRIAAAFLRPLRVGIGVVDRASTALSLLENTTFAPWPDSWTSSLLNMLNAGICRKCR